MLIFVTRFVTYTQSFFFKNTSADTPNLLYAVHTLCILPLPLFFFFYHHVARCISTSQLGKRARFLSRIPRTVTTSSDGPILTNDFGEFLSSSFSHFHLQAVVKKKSTQNAIWILGHHGKFDRKANLIDQDFHVTARCQNSGSNGGRGKTDRAKFWLNWSSL